MKNNKLANILMAGLFIFPVVGIQRINPELIPATATSTPTASPAIKLINPNLLKKVDMIEFKNINRRGELKNVKVTAKDATSITVDNEGVSVKATVSTNTHFRRKFWGKSSLAEISVGDSVDIIGKWSNEGKTEIKALVIRNLSIQKRFGAFFGTVKSITDTGFVMTTIQKGDETVVLDSAKLIDRKGQAITASDIQIGHKVRVKGLWDSVKFTITEVSQVKDFSIPILPSPTPES